MSGHAGPSANRAPSFRKTHVFESCTTPLLSTGYRLTDMDDVGHRRGRGQKIHKTNAQKHHGGRSRRRRGPRPLMTQFCAPAGNPRRARETVRYGILRFVGALAVVIRGSSLLLPRSWPQGRCPASTAGGVVVVCGVL